MTNRCVHIAGPFTDDELLDIIAVVQRIERERPDETFTVGVSAEGEGDDFDPTAFIAAIPLPPGYGRVAGVFPREGS